MVTGSRRSGGKGARHRPGWKGSLPANKAKSYDRRPAGYGCASYIAEVSATVSTRNGKKRAADVRLPGPAGRDGWLKLWTDHHAYGPQGGSPPPAEEIGRTAGREGGGQDV